MRLPPAWQSAGLTVGVALTGVAITVGIVRPQLVDIDRLLGGTMLYGTLAIAVIAIDAVVLGVTSRRMGRYRAYAPENAAARTPDSR